MGRCFYFSPVLETECVEWGDVLFCLVALEAQRTGHSVGLWSGECLGLRDVGVEDV